MTTQAEPRPRTTTPPEAQPQHRSSRWWAWICGVIAGLAGLTVADLFAWILITPGSPVTAVGQWIISLLPAGMIDFGKDFLGTADKPVLMAIVGLFALVVAGFAGRLERLRQFLGAVVFAALAAITLVAVHSLADATGKSYVPTIGGLIVGYLILRLLIGRLRRLPDNDRPGTEPSSMEQVDRRNFLRLTIVLGVVAAAGSIGARALSAAATKVSEARSKLVLPRPATPAPPVPAGADLRLDGLTPYVSANGNFYRVDTALQPPQIDPADWSLSITGMVDHEVSLSFADLMAKPLVEHMITLTCVSNEVGGNLAGNATWLGYPIRQLLAEAGPQAGADMVLSTSHDGFTAGTPLSILQDPGRQALLAVGMNGEPLPIEHGFPARMVVPGLYGYVSATKWVTQLKVTTFADDRAYWTDLGWAEKGPIKIASRIDTPRKQTIPAGTTTVAGVAWDQHTGISKVEVRVDSQDWQEAQLAEVVGPDTWRQWVWIWDATPGDHVLKVRATNLAGELQTTTVADPVPDGASGLHQISVHVN